MSQFIMNVKCRMPLTQTFKSKHGGLLDIKFYFILISLISLNAFYHSKDAIAR